MQSRLGVALLCALSALWIVGCGETAETPGAGGTSGSGGAGGTSGSGGARGGAGSGGAGGDVGLCGAVDTSCDQDGGSFCDDAGRCVECNRIAQCSDDGNECTVAACDVGACVTANAGGTCDYMDGAGICADGVCVDADSCDPYPCQDRGECVVDQCDPSDGLCSYANAPVDTPCNEDGGRVCDGSGDCVGCNHSSQCDDGDPCTTDFCFGRVNACSHPPAADGLVCGDAAICLQGQCASDLLGQQYFSGNKGDLTSGLYTVYEGFYRYGLAGFYFDFTPGGVDHELERLMPGFIALDYNPSLPGDETAIYARYEDNNADDAYDWRIDGQKLPWGTTRHVTTRCRESGGTFTIRTGVSDDWVPVLLGFDLDRSTDHNVGDVQVRVDKTGTNVWLAVAFADSSDDDSYCYRVHYGLVPAGRVRATGYSQGDGATSDTETIDAQAPILQGLRIGYRGTVDSHIDELGLRLLPGRVQAWFHDDDTFYVFQWEVWWADLS